ncbi:MAG TPA: hypothetical protein VF489_05320 [Sphingobium sp.]
MPLFPPSPEQALLLLGRLDGRLANSPATDIWLARSRLRGAAALASFAGVPVAVKELQDWICGRTPPPRYSEGLNDPLSVAALVHFALSATEGRRDPIARATLNISRRLLDDREEARTWAAEYLVRFGPAWRSVQERLEAPYPAASLHGVAQRLLEVARGLEAPLAAGQLLTTADGRQLRIDPRRADLLWVVACHVPGALEASGLALRRLPSFVGLPRFLAEDADALAEQLAAMIGRQAREGLAELDRIEAQLARLPATCVTKRSKAPLLMRLELAYPGLSKMAVARLLDISHQGATKLVAQVEAMRASEGAPRA